MTVAKFLFISHDWFICFRPIVEAHWARSVSDYQQHGAHHCQILHELNHSIFVGAHLRELVSLETEEIIVEAIAQYYWRNFEVRWRKKSLDPLSEE